LSFKIGHHHENPLNNSLENYLEKGIQQNPPSTFESEKNEQNDGKTDQTKKTRRILYFLCDFCLQKLERKKNTEYFLVHSLKQFNKNISEKYGTFDIAMNALESRQVAKMKIVNILEKIWKKFF
jgi:hypothetical protein